jgi:tRNA(Ile)-lysidine synthase
MTNEKMTSQVRAYIEAQRLLNPRDTVLIALSGGADSVALLRVLLALGYTVEAAHCNFHLRGAESDRDEQFVRALCQQHGVILHVQSFDTTAYAAAHRVSIEMAAREQRYAWFEALRQQRGLTVIAVAHHREDSVETLLINLLRGTGLHGLTGIAPRNGHLIRPLLGVSKQAILDYLQHLGQPFVTDSTNLQATYRRNKIRLEVLPLLQDINPSVVQTLADTADRLRQAEVVYQHAMEEAKQRVIRPVEKSSDTFAIHIDTLLSEPSPEALLHEILHPLGFNSAQQKDILRTLRSDSGRRVLAPEWELLRDRDSLLLRRRLQTENAENSAATPTQEAPTPKLHIEHRPRTIDFVIPRDKHIACLDAALVRQPLTLRHPQPGDRFVPFGMRGSKLLSDYFTDRKYTVYRKQQQWLLCSGPDIVWVVNERPDARYCVSERTKEVLLIWVEE